MDENVKAAMADDSELTAEDKKRLKKFIRNQRHQTANLIRKCKLKTRTAWIAAGFIQQANLMPGKTQDQIYEALKFFAQQELTQEALQEKNNETV